MDEREALMWLCLCPGLTPNQRRSFLRCYKTAVHSVAQARAKGISGPPFECMQKALQSDWIDWNDARYPARLRHLDEPPEILFYRGDLSRLDSDQASVTIVGTRRATSQGRHVAARFAAALCQAGVRIVSGFAKGIDSAAHWASLGPENYPIAVLGCGLDHCYPSENFQLLRRIEDNGIVLSEYPPGTQPLAFHYHARNRLLAALADAVLVVEAPARSGTMLTVDHALKLGRDVFVLPGPVDHPNYQGNLNLLQEGAILTRTPADLLTQLTLSSPPPPGQQLLASARPFESPARAEEWALRLGLALPTAMTQLSLWERSGTMQRDREGYFSWTNGVGVGAGASGAGMAGRPVGSKGRFSNS